MMKKGLNILLGEETEYMTVIEFRDWLNEIIEEGHGDKEIWFGYDSNCVYTAYFKRKYDIIKNEVRIKE